MRERLCNAHAVCWVRHEHPLHPVNALRGQAEPRDLRPLDLSTLELGDHILVILRERHRVRKHRPNDHAQRPTIHQLVIPSILSAQDNFGRKVRRRPAERLEERAAIHRLC